MKMKTLIMWLRMMQWLTLRYFGLPDHLDKINPKYDDVLHLRTKITPG
jgi:hypothetical protein